MATGSKSTASPMASSRPNTRPELRQLLAVCGELRTEGERLRAKAKRLRLDCVKARLDLAERLATFADANRSSAQFADFFRKKALETFASVRRVILKPDWTGMDRVVLETGLAGLHSLLVDLKFSELDTEIRSCSVDGHYLGPAVEKTPDSGVIGNAHCDPLTRREVEVLKCVAEGHSTKQIGEILGITFKTAACHRYRAMDKLDIHDTATLVRYAIRVGLVQA